jgi:sulfatase maturation enzyme AslB (radical SAM superfamily)
MRKNELTMRCHLTLECNFSCKYCTTPQAEIETMPWQYWVNIINFLPYDEVRFSGGEPFYYDDFVEILKRINARAVVYTNFSLWKTEYAEAIKPERVRFYISVHPEADLKKMATDLLQLSGAGFRFEVHSIETKKPNKALFMFMEKCKKLGYTTNINKDQWEFTANLFGKRRSDICHLDRSLFGPDGKRYPCLTKMIAQKDPVKWQDFTGIACSRADCLPCDMASLYGGAGVVTDEQLDKAKKTLVTGQSVYDDEEFKG